MPFLVIIGAILSIFFWCFYAVSYIFGVFCAFVWLIKYWPWYAFVKKKLLHDLQSTFEHRKTSLRQSLQKFRIHQFPAPGLESRLGQQLIFRYRHLKALVELNLSKDFHSLAELDAALFEVSDRANDIDETHDQMNELISRTLAKGFSETVKRYHLIGRMTS